MRSPALLAVGCVTALVAVAPFASCSPYAEAEPTDAGTEGASPTDAPQGDDGPIVVEPPPGCDLGLEPKDAPLCVADAVGIFVDASKGNDNAAGTKAAPLKTIGAAIARGNRPRVYICQGNYPEHLRLANAMSLHGGFACDWTYTGQKPVVHPTDAGYALEVAGVKTPIVVADMKFDSIDAGGATLSSASLSSIAVFAHDVTNLTMTRVALVPGTGAKGAPGNPGTGGSYVGGGSPNGNDGSGPTAGTAKTCQCNTSGNTTGGRGGGAGQSGAEGLPTYPGGIGQADNDGKGGLSNGLCGGPEPNGDGNSGATAPPTAAAAPPMTLGTLDATGFTPQAGNDGTAGKGGQGGGGGGSAQPFGGGGGGCGGCAGSGGQGGRGGGSSIALLAFSAPVKIVASTFTAANAGDGGSGGGGGPGANGGLGGKGSCNGGAGGPGANGGAGSGGAGGISAAIVSKGEKPTADASSSLGFAKAGAGGPGGANNNAGPAGLAAATVEIP